jgi:WXXGXW repeat (2 copies)
MIGVRQMSFRGLLLAAAMLPAPMALMAPTPAAAQIGVVLSVQLAPPALPIYVQPPIPEVGYIWTPGYWHWDAAAGYYWVPGTWVLPPTPGVLWTPPYWGWTNGLYIFHGGYWGPHVGFYGGVNYGFGYGGVGFDGGRWEGGRFAYNQAVNNFGSVHVDNVYRQNVTVINNTHVSFNGGPGGVRGMPTPAEVAAEHENHMPLTPDQTRHITSAAGNPAFAARSNNGRPAIAATARPAQFEGPGVVRAQGAVARPEGGARPEAARPEGARPEAARPEGGRPEGARPEGGRPEGARPEGARPEAARPEGARPEAARPEGGRPEGARPEGGRPGQAPGPRAAAARPAARPYAAPPRPAARPAPQRAAPAREEKRQ